MTPRHSTVALALAGLALPLAAAEETLTVCPSGCDFTSVIEAVESAADGDVIQLSAGTYLEGTTIVIDKALTLRGAGSKDGQATTVLDGAGLHRIVDASTGQMVTIEDIRFQNGLGGVSTLPYDGGGAIHSGDNLFVRNCEFVDNATNDYSSGGAISTYFANGVGVLIEDCRFTGNTSTLNGGAIALTRSFGTLRNCTFESNESIGQNGGQGGAIHIQAADDVVRFLDCTFTGNSASDTGEYAGYDGAGGALSMGNGSSCIMLGCAFSGNQADRGGAVYTDHSLPRSITSSTFESNSVGAIYVDFWELEFQICEPGPWGNIEAPEIQIVNSTFSSNSVGSEERGNLGTAITSDYTNLSLIGSTFSNNGGDATDVLILDRSGCPDSFSPPLGAYDNSFQDNQGTLFSNYTDEVRFAANTICGTDQSVGSDDWVDSFFFENFPEDYPLADMGNDFHDSCEDVPSGDNPLDANGDGVYDAEDVRLSMAEFGIVEAGPCPADTNADGAVDGQDLAAVLANWGLPCGP